MIEKGELNKITLRHSEKKQRKDKTRNIDKYVVEWLIRRPSPVIT